MNTVTSKDGVELLRQYTSTYLSSPKGDLFFSHKRLAKYNSNEENYSTGDLIDLEGIDTAYANDGYVARIMHRYIDLIFKFPPSFVSESERARKWVLKRIGEIEENSGQPFKQHLKQVALDMVKYSNSILFKLRSSSATYKTSGKMWLKGKTKMKPIVSLIGIPLSFVQLNVDKKKTKDKLENYIVTRSDGKQFRLQPRDTIHFKIYYGAGDILGKAMAGPVVADVRALRRMEENVELTVFNYAIPFVHVVIGSPEEPVDRPTLLSHKIEIEDMALNGLFITNHQYDIKAVHTANAAVDATPFLEHYKKRIFGGMGSSAVELGEGGTASRSTALTIDRVTQEVAKQFQDQLEEFVNFYLLNELLREANLPMDVKENLVTIQFPEIDLDALIAMESHVLNKYNSNMITFEEARTKIGEKQLTKKQEERLRANMFPNDPADTSSQISNVVQPANQYGKKKAPTPAANE